MKIGIDIDGVLTNLEKWQIETGKKFLNKEVENIEGYEIYQIFNVPKQSDKEFWNKYLYEYVINEPAREGASETIQFLKEQGHEIYIITARYLTTRNDASGEEMRQIVKEWLKKYQIYYDEIIFSPEDKVENCMKNNIDIMIEDKKENIENISKNIPVICFNAEYNKYCKAEKIHRAYSWYDIKDLVCTLNKNNK